MRAEGKLLEGGIREYIDCSSWPLNAGHSGHLYIQLSKVLWALKGP